MCRGGCVPSPLPESHMDRASMLAALPTLHAYAKNIRSVLPRYMSLTGLPDNQTSGPGLTAYLVSLQTTPHALAEEVLHSLCDLLDKDNPMNNPLPASMLAALPLLPGQHPSTVEEHAPLATDFQVYSIRTCACEMRAHGVPTALAALAAPLPSQSRDRQCTQLLALTVLHTFASTLLSAAAPEAPVLEACFAVSSRPPGIPKSRTFQAAVKSSLLAPSVTSLVQHGVKHPPIAWICAFAGLVSVLAERQTTVLDTTASLVNVLLEILDVRGAEADPASGPASR